MHFLDPAIPGRLTRAGRNCSLHATVKGSSKTAVSRVIIPRPYERSCSHNFPRHKLPLAEQKGQQISADRVVTGGNQGEVQPQSITRLPHIMDFMKRSLPVFLILAIALALSAGCMQPSPATVPQPDIPVTTTVVQAATTALPATATTSAAPQTTAAPQVTVTVIHYIVPVKAWKDSELHFSFEAPQDWKVTTRQQSLPEGSQGLEYRTELVANDAFYLLTYPINLNQDQAYRNTFRTWVPAPAESTVTYNTIVYDRFESTKDGKSHVGYVARKSSANDIGFTNVFVYETDTSRPFEKEDFEKVVASFAYFTKAKAATVTGEEIPRVR